MVFIIAFYPFKLRKNKVLQTTWWVISVSFDQQFKNKPKISRFFANVCNIAN